jgi:outer membrane beta-barrel protein
MLNAYRTCALWRKIIFLGAALFSAHTAVAADDLSPSELRGNPNKQPVSVLQNRFFLKAMRPEIGILAGSFLNEAYTKTTTTGFRVGLFINEWFGVEGQYAKTQVKDSEDRKALNRQTYRDLEEDKQVSPDAEVNPIYSVTDINAVIAPFYGKLNLLNQYIVYSDLYLSAGGAKVETSQGDINAFVIGVGQRFYMLNALSVRIDFRDRMYTEQRGGKDSRKNALSIDLGVSYFFL